MTESPAPQRFAAEPRQRFIAKLWAQPAGRFGLIVCGIVVLVALVALVWTPYDPQQTDVPGRWASPSLAHPLGTDASGRDLLSLIMAGSRITVLVALGAGVVSLLVGLGLASLGALTRRWVREIVAVAIDILIAFPVLIIAMMLSAVFGGSLLVVVTAVGIGFGVNMARVVRPEMRRVLQSDYVLAGRAAGLSTSQNLVRHVLPGISPIVIVQLSWGMAVAVLAEAGLSYLGFGAPVTDASWGLLLGQLSAYLTAYPFSVVWPGLAITLTVLGLNQLGDGLRDASDPTLGRGRGSTRTNTQAPAVTA